MLLHYMTLGVYIIFYYMLYDTWKEKEEIMEF